MRTHLTLALGVLLLAACGSSSPTTPGQLVMETLVSSAQSGFPGPERRAVHDESAWIDAWHTVHEGLEPMPAVPAVDFSARTVIVAAAGTRANGCYSIAIAAVVPTGENGFEVEVVETVPGPGCVCTQALTQPVHVISVVGAASAVSFVERSSERAC